MPLKTRDVWADGFEAFERGWPLRKNPYPVNTELHDTWVSGWLAAEDDEYNQINQNPEEDLRPW